MLGPIFYIPFIFSFWPHAKLIIIPRRQRLYQKVSNDNNWIEWGVKCTKTSVGNVNYFVKLRVYRNFNYEFASILTSSFETIYLKKNIIFMLPLAFEMANFNK